MRSVVTILLIGAWLCSVATAGPADATLPANESGDDAVPGKPQLIIRLDDVGFCHGANEALKRVLDAGVCTSVSVIVNTPWLDEAVELLRHRKGVSVGVHLTLNSEWREFRWGPVVPYDQVSSLVDEDGHFYASRAALLAQSPRIDELEKELRAQIELARRKGLPISYLDYHMGAAMSTPEMQKVVEKLAREYELGISQYFGETYAPTVYRISPEAKLAEAIKIIEGMNESKLYLFVLHPGLNTPEMAAMTDRNSTGVTDMSRHRQAVTDLLCHPAFREAIERQGIELVNYNTLKAREIIRMARPWLADPYRTMPKSRSDKPR